MLEKCLKNLFVVSVFLKTLRKYSIITIVLAWFKESKDDNIIYTYRNDEENKDVHMVALRDDDGTLIGYYEKHEYRNRETTGLYDFKKN